MTDSRITEARSLATERQEGQFRKGSARLPYVVHCEEVAALVARYGGSEDAIVAAWLHDIVEDTDTTAEEIRARFGKAVASIVLEVTDDPGLGKEVARAQQVLSAPRKSLEAALIKAADQASNMLSIVNTPPYWSNEERLAYIAKRVLSSSDYLRQIRSRPLSQQPLRQLSA